MKYNTEYEYFEEDYLDKWILNINTEEAKISASLIPKEIIKIKDLQGLIKDETEELMKFFKENDIIPYLSLKFNDGIHSGVPEIEYSGPKEMMSPLEEPFKTCVNPTSFLRKKWHSVLFNQFNNTREFRENINKFLKEGYTTYHLGIEIFEKGKEIAHIDACVGKVIIYSNKILEGIRIIPKNLSISSPK